MVLYWELSTRKPKKKEFCTVDCSKSGKKGKEEQTVQTVRLVLRSKKRANSRIALILILGYLFF